MNTTMASYANLSLYSAMGVLALSMLAYLLYLASLGPVRADKVRAEAELVTAGAGGAGGVGGATGVVTPAAATVGDTASEASLRGRKAAALGYYSPGSPRRSSRCR